MAKTKKAATTGYKVTNPDMSCRNFKYELGKLYKHDGVIQLCGSGFHFCEQINNCFNYYDFNPNNKVFEIEAYGDVINGDDKSVCSEIKFIREIPWAEVLVLANTGHSNTGHSNTGDWNSGDRNSGNRNSGDRNSGNWNSGNWNSGNWNSGNRNSGNWNSGNWNSGNWNSGNRNSGNWNSGYWNSGDRNSGNRNSGDRNSGNWNSGNWNSGNWNSGNRNSGNWNSGNWNSGNWNSGNRNSGNWNSGYRNSGDSNSGYRNSGAFCTDNDPVMILFNKPTKMTVREWESTEACNLMYNIEPNIWVPENMMSKEEKEANPKWETTGGYLKAIPMHEAWANFWHNLTDKNKKVFTSLPNFDADLFKEITGIEV
jgi:hypothetical protein